MLFQEQYFVDFSNGNLKPSKNDRHWPDLTHAPNNLADQPDPWGYILHAKRTSGTQAPAVENNLYVDLSQHAITLHTRILLKVEFDVPTAHSFPNDPGHPEPWAVGLGVSRIAGLDSKKMAGVTCQFNRAKNGVRVNMPERLQSDDSPMLHTPLNYARYRYLPWIFGASAPAKSTFTLEHSFCGFDKLWNVPNGYTIGAGRLSIKTGLQTDVDHRLYSTDTASFPDPTPGATYPPDINAVGVSLVVTGVGAAQVRLRSFSISLRIPNVSPALTNRPT